MPAKNGVVLVIDVQRGFNPSDRLVRNISEFCKSLSDECAVVATRFINHPGLPYYRSGWTKMTEGGQLDLISDIGDQVQLVVDKSEYSALNQLEAADVVMDSGPIYVTGMDTEACVLHTAVDLYEHHYDVRVISNLCESSGGESMHTSGINILSRSIGRDRVLLSGGVDLSSTPTVPGERTSSV